MSCRDTAEPPAGLHFTDDHAGGVRSRDGSLSTPEVLTIILPHPRWIDEQAAEAMLRFAAAGA